MGLDEIKLTHKKKLCAYLREKGIEELVPEGIFDMQICSIHEFRRQQLNALYIIDKYLEIKAGHTPVRPLQFIFAGKADPADRRALDILHLFLLISHFLTVSPQRKTIAGHKIRLVFLLWPHYLHGAARVLI